MDAETRSTVRGFTLVGSVKRKGKEGAESPSFIGMSKLF
jgi:hypothetical protein